MAGASFVLLALSIWAFKTDTTTLVLNKMMTLQKEITATPQLWTDAEQKHEVRKFSPDASSNDGLDKFLVAYNQSMGLFDDILNLAWKNLQQCVEARVNRKYIETPMENSE